LLRHVWNQDEHQELASWRLIEANLHLVVSIAKRHASAGRPVLDLVESGNSGLIFALQTFAKGAGGEFSAHAANCIVQAIPKAITESS
jgi:RNA polymerase primary sigma factor